MRVRGAGTVLVLVAVAAALFPAPAGAALPGADPPGRHSSGLALVGPSDTDPDAPGELLALAYDDAVREAEAHPDTYGYPWLDRARGRLVVSGVGARGAEQARAFRPRAEAAGVARTVREVTRSWAALEKVKDDATRLVGAGVPDAELIWATEPDDAHNRVVVTVDALSDPLLDALAARYGTDAVAVRVEPRPVSSGTDATRNDDTSPFWGGAKIYVSGTCTSGFPWNSGTTQMMLTAAHCRSTGGAVSTPAESMGTVTSGSRENWHDTYGTQYYTGQSVYRGDVALIQMYSGKYAGTRIYRGGAGSSSNATVKEMWSRSPATGDQYCTGGHVAGELCGWKVDKVRYNQLYDRDGPNVWARNINRGSKGGWCTRPGDSGGPIFTVRSDGGIAAKGIHSGGGGGGSDYYGGAFDPCREYFTDIREAYYGLPGYLKVG